ncbi:FGGY-family carbohydrate kinase [Georgenia ruanii]|nr:FGGY-family carbohydrate kinase [Georgenia ruanii]MPV89645.1 carbohydrate kinase [Georgenia ruanii]
MICHIGVDVGLTAAKAAAFDDDGRELWTVRASNPRIAVSADRQEVDMDDLWDVVAGVLRDLTAHLAATGHTPVSLAVTGHGNGLYPVDEHLRPVRPAIASTDSRAQDLAAEALVGPGEALRDLTGSMPWAAQPAVLLRWLHDHEPDSLARVRWALSCKDWLTTRLIGEPSADYSDASAMGLLRLSSRAYAPEALEAVGLPGDLTRLFPPVRASDAVAGTVTPEAAAATGLPAGLPVAAGCMDCVASPLGAAASAPGDVTVIVGTWAINAVVVPSTAVPPRVTLNALLPEPGTMLAMEVAPTSSASLEWLSAAVTRPAVAAAEPRELLEAAADAPPGSEGLYFLPFVHGAPAIQGASGTLVGASARHGHAHVARAVAEGVAQYHRVQVEALRTSGTAMSAEPWTLAGGGARNPVWAQIFADVLGHPVRRQLGTELGARGAASLGRAAVDPTANPWRLEQDPGLVVHPGVNQALYARQALVFDALLDSLRPAWATLHQEARSA